MAADIYTPHKKPVGSTKPLERSNLERRKIDVLITAGRRTVGAACSLISSLLLRQCFFATLLRETFSFPFFSESSGQSGVLDTNNSVGRSRKGVGEVISFFFSTHRLLPHPKPLSSFEVLSSTLFFFFNSLHDSLVRSPFSLLSTHSIYNFEPVSSFQKHILSCATI